MGPVTRNRRGPHKCLPPRGQNYGAIVKTVNSRSYNQQVVEPVTNLNLSDPKPCVWVLISAIPPTTGAILQKFNSTGLSLWLKKEGAAFRGLSVSTCCDSVIHKYRTTPPPYLMLREWEWSSLCVFPMGTHQPRSRYLCSFPQRHLCHCDPNHLDKKQGPRDGDFQLLR